MTRQAFVAASFAVAAVAAAQQSEKPTAADGNASQRMMQVMTQSSKDMQAMPMNDDVDRDFAMMMRMHHKSGVEMAEIEAHRGRDPKMKAMAQKIIKSQTREIREFDRWLSTKR